MYYAKIELCVMERGHFKHVTIFTQPMFFEYFAFLALLQWAVPHNNYMAVIPWEIRTFPFFVGLHSHL